MFQYLQGTPFAGWGMRKLCSRSSSGCQLCLTTHRFQLWRHKLYPHWTAAKRREITYTIEIQRPVLKPPEWISSHIFTPRPMPPLLRPHFFLKDPGKQDVVFQMNMLMEVGFETLQCLVQSAKTGAYVAWRDVVSGYLS